MCNCWEKMGKDAMCSVYSQHTCESNTLYILIVAMTDSISDQHKQIHFGTSFLLDRVAGNKNITGKDNLNCSGEQQRNYVDFSPLDQFFFFYTKQIRWIDISSPTHRDIFLVLQKGSSKSLNITSIDHAWRPRLNLLLCNRKKKKNSEQINLYTVFLDKVL